MSRSQSTTFTMVLFDDKYQNLIYKCIFCTVFNFAKIQPLQSKVSYTLGHKLTEKKDKPLAIGKCADFPKKKDTTKVLTMIWSKQTTL